MTLLSSILSRGSGGYYCRRSLDFCLFSKTKSINHHRQVSSGSFSSHYSDVVIVGGGVVGCSLARLLNERLPSLSVSLLEAREGPPPLKPASSSSTTTTATTTTRTTTTTPLTIPHPRSYALSPRSLEILGTKTLETIPLGYYTSMQVWESKNPATLIFTNQDLQESLYSDSSNDDSSSSSSCSSQYLGAVVEDVHLVQSLWEQLQEQQNRTTCYTNTTIEDIQFPLSEEETIQSDQSISSSSSSCSSSSSSSLVTVTTNCGKKLTTPLLVGADGANSQIRNRCGIPMVGFEYGKHALTFTVQLDGMGHQQRAFQRFLPDGPIALLPTYSKNHSIVVWSTTPEIAQKYKQRDTSMDTELVQQLCSIFQEGPQRLPPLLEHNQSLSSLSSSFSSLSSSFLSGCERIIDTVQYGITMMAAQQQGNPNSMYQVPPTITEIVSPKFSFPLSCKHVQQYVKPHVALVGDAAHTVHPMAGQGLNIGLADVQTLVHCLEQKVKVGMTYHDIYTLQTLYESNRQRQVTMTLAGIHGLHELFGQQDVSMKHMKSFGMNVIQSVSPLRKKMVHQAAYGLAL